MVTAGLSSGAEGDQLIVDMGAFERWAGKTPDLWRLERAGEFADRLGEHVAQCYGSLDRLHLSFDVFDTLLLRSSRCEQERFYEVSSSVQALIPHASAWDIFAARCRAHALAYECAAHKDGVPEATLRQVLSGTLALLGQDAGLLSALEAAELEFEREELRCHPGLEAFLSTHYAGRPVLLLSDMYLSADQISQLVRANYPELEFRVYVSNECGLSKRSGTLYGHALREEGLAASSMLHMGDNIKSDVFQAKRAGWGALHFPVPAKEEKLRAQTEAKFEEKVRRELSVALSALR